MSRDNTQARLARQPRTPAHARPRSALVRRASLAALIVFGLCPQLPARAAPPQLTPDSSPANSSPASSSEPRELSVAFAGFMASVETWDLDAAGRRRDGLTDLRERELATGVIEIYAARYPEAESVLAGVIAGAQTGTQDGPQDPVTARAAYFLDLARGAQLALGDATTIRSDDGRFEAVFADPRDELLAPYLFESMASAYDELGDDIGVHPDHPIRFEIYDAPGKLALVTPLTLDNIYTTGTVGICKYRRIMMISPRVMLYGYGWLDTAVHEYVHYLVTMRSNNAAPVWMQEGLAKLMEVRWREADQPKLLEPAIRKLLHDALESDQLVTLEQMHPSVAMLPSQELAALAYAEAETMLGLLEEQRGPAAVAAMLDDVAGGVDAKQAFADAWGDDFEVFFAVWKRTMKTRTAGTSTATPLSGVAFRDDEDDPEEDPSLHGDVFSHLGGGRARKHARLGVLLTLRGHTAAAVIEYERARAVDRSTRDDPKLARRLGELYLELDRAAEALPLLRIAGEDDPDNPNIAAAEARARRLTGDDAGARIALARAVRQNPFIPGIHCDLAALARDPVSAARERELCMD